MNFLRLHSKTVNSTQNNYIELPVEALDTICSHFIKERELQRFSRVCTKWNKHVIALNQKSLQFCEKFGIFGINFWLSRGFHVGNVPRLPQKIIQNYSNPSPIFEGETTLETSLCLLCPAKVNGKLLKDQIKKIFLEYLSTDLVFINEDNYREISLYVRPLPKGEKQSYWLIITKNGIPKLDNSEDRLFAFETLIEKTKTAYKLPNAYEILLSYVLKPNETTLPQVIICDGKDELGLLSIKNIKKDSNRSQKAVNYLKKNSSKKKASKETKNEFSVRCSSILSSENEIKAMTVDVRSVQRFYG